MALKDKVKALGRTVQNFVKKNPHVWLSLYVPAYLLVFLAAEHMVVDNYYVSYMPLDDKIPFVACFVVPYYLWFPYLVLPGLYFMFRDPAYFRKYMYFLMIGFSASIAFCVLFPNGQNLRPETFATDDIFTRLVAAIYRADTNTNVIPSMHVVGSVAVLSAILRCPTIKSRLAKISSLVLAGLITASTVLIKQHSFLDIIAAGVLCVPIFLGVYGRDLAQSLAARSHSLGEAKQRGG